MGLLNDEEITHLDATKQLCSEIDTLLKHEMPDVTTRRYDAALAHFNKLLESV